MDEDELSDEYRLSLQGEKSQFIFFSQHNTRSKIGQPVTEMLHVASIEGMQHIMPTTEVSSDFTDSSHISDIIALVALCFNCSTIVSVARYRRYRNSKYWISGGELYFASEKLNKLGPFKDYL